MKVTVLTFGLVKDLIGTNQIEVENIFTVKELIHRLYELYPTLSSLNNLQWALNEEYINDFSIQIKENDVFAIIPPVSGG